MVDLHLLQDIAVGIVFSLMCYFVTIVIPLYKLVDTCAVHKGCVHPVVRNTECLQFAKLAVLGFDWSPERSVAARKDVDEPTGGALPSGPSIK